MARFKQITVPSAPSSALYSQAIVAGDFLFISGQIPVNPTTGKLVEGGVIQQAEQVFRNIGEILKGAGLDFTALVRVEIYLKDINDLAAVNKLYLEKLPHSPKPARQAMQIGNLPFESLIEVSCIAMNTPNS